ncbi:MAG: hypothetical protein JSV42_13360 [Chloroflexota bacterium]|nr:MAG: hypothetical protein JSV42_13360 [Chloroflexota bacterium]
MSNGLKTTFLIHAPVSLLFGIVFYFFPGTWANLVNWTPFDENITRLLGAAVLAIGMMSWFAYRAESWQEVRVPVLFEIVFTVSGSLIGLYAYFFSGAPLFIWVPIAVMVIFGVLWIYFYRQETS